MFKTTIRGLKCDHRIVLLRGSSKEHIPCWLGYFLVDCYLGSGACSSQTKMGHYSITLVLPHIIYSVLQTYAIILVPTILF